MSRHMLGLSVVAVVAVVGCSDDAADVADLATSVTTVDVDESITSGERPSSSVSAPLNTTSNTATVATVATNPASIDEPSAEPGLAVLAAAPSESDISVTAERLSDDRVIRRGGQSEIAQGQTFSVAQDAVLTGVSFEVVPDGAIDEGTRLGLSLFVVADPVRAIPSAHVDLGDQLNPIELALPEPLTDGEPVHVAFTFDGVPLSAATAYAAVLSLADGASGAELHMQHAESDQYPDGIAIRIEGATWKTDRVVGDQAVSLTFDA